MVTLSWKHITGNTWCLDGHLTIPVYFLDTENVVLLDTGFAHLDREPICTCLAEKNLRVRAIIGSHSHNDHSGSHAYFQQTQGTELILRDLESAISSDFAAMTLAYRPGSPADMEREFPQLLCRADRVFRQEDTSVTVEGADFGLIPLPGHTVGQTGIVTPDGVFYVADAIIDEETLRSAKLPSTTDWRKDLETKKRLLEMDYPWYVLAHKGAHTDIRELVERNIADRRERTDIIWGHLAEAEELNLSEIEQLLWKKLGLTSRSYVSQTIFRRNVNCVMDYLVDTGRVEKTFRDGTCWYRTI